MESGAGRAVKSADAGVVLAQALARELEPVSVVDQAIQNRVGESGIADEVMPGVHGNLAGHNRRGAAMPIIEDLQKVAPLGLIEHRQAPIVEDQEFNPAERLEQPAVAAVPTSERQRLEQARNPMVEH